jgi:Baseplate J-like protein
VSTGTVAAPVVFSADLDREARRALVEGRTDLDGIDFVEVLSNHRGTPGHVRGAPAQRTLLVHLLNRPVPADWRAHRVTVVGGVRADPRVNPVGVQWAYPAPLVAGVGPADLPPGVDAADAALVEAAMPADPAGRDRVLVVRTTTSGDWSTYALHLLGDGGTGVPDGFDAPLAQAPFTFTVDCPGDLDCCTPAAGPVPPATSPALDYLARDADALTARLLDRLSVLLPGWGDRSAADPAVMLVELLGHLGDRLAYWQDAVAVEAHLGTARRRTSVRRHARLLDYAVHDGSSGRVLLALTTTVPTTLAAGAAVADMAGPAGLAGGLLPVDADEVGAIVVETCTDVALHPTRNAVELHAWGDPEHVLATGSTSAYLAAPSAADPGLAAGDLLVLADCPAGLPGSVALGDPARRFAVRLDRDPASHADLLAAGRTVYEVHWHAEDALPSPLQVTEPGPDGAPAVRAVALANVVVADHGATVPWELLEPPQPADGLAYRPRLARTGLAFAQPVDPVAAAGAPAADLTRPDPRAAVAQLTLDDGQRLWRPRPDLVASSRLDPHVVVEPEADGVARIRFGDGVTGRAPTGQLPHSARYRLGGGARGNVGAGRLVHWLPRADGSPADVSGAVLTVWNPLPAAGGTDPEPLDAVRQLAPSAYRRQLRAITSADHAAAAQEISGVQRSVARRRWTGSWYVQEVTVDPQAARAADPAVRAAVLDLLELRRLAGTDVEVAQPVYVPLEIALSGCLAAGFVAADVERQLLDALSARVLPGGTLGFFHPDRFTFGQPLYLSDLVGTAMEVPGLTRVEVRRFARLGAGRGATRTALAAGRIDVGSREVLRCDSDPNDPEAGRVEVELGGGS